MNIRRAINSDMDDINRLLYQVANVHHLGRPDLFKQGAKKYDDCELLEIIADDSRPIFVAVDEQERVLGYAFCVYQLTTGSHALNDIRTLYIDDICVDEQVRGQHVGTALYEHVLSFAKAQGFYNVTLNVWSCNPAAMKFYERMGLTPYKVGMEQIL